jgi:hypothetical protein
MSRQLTILALIIPLLLTCGQAGKREDPVDRQRLIETLIQEMKFEEARIAAIETLHPDIKRLYYKADDSLGHASHLDVNCNARIEELLTALLQQVPDRETKARRDIYYELSGLFPKNDDYRKHFIYLDRKIRGVKQ